MLDPRVYSHRVCRYPIFYVPLLMDCQRTLKRMYDLAIVKKLTCYFFKIRLKLLVL